MNCSELERWLDAGMPDDGSSHALAHAGRCRVCAPALAEARAVEAALRAEAKGAAASTAAAASAGFVNAVMARVEAEAAATRPVEGPAGPGGADVPTPWWLHLFADPVSVVSVTLSIVVGTVAVLKPGWFAAGASAVLAFGHRAGEGLAAWPVLSSPSHAALALAAAIAPLLAVVAVAVYRSFERAIVLVAGGRRR